MKNYKWNLLSHQIPKSPRELLDVILSNRKISDIPGFLEPPSPFEILKNDPQFSKILEESKKAAALIKNAIKENCPIIIHGDYDADGQCATAIMVRAIRDGLNYKNVFSYTPNRFDEGYGLSIESINSAKTLLEKNGHNFSNSIIKPLLITVDCGIVSITETEKAKKDFTVIITDHHEPAKDLPNADCLVWTSLTTGAGIAYILARILKDSVVVSNSIKESDQGEYSDLAAIGIICDLGPLLGLNRSICKLGLEKINTSPTIGIKALRESARIAEDVEAYHIGWVIGPRLNATGRLETAKDAVQLLITNDPAEAKQIAEKLNDLNIQRQNQTTANFEEAMTLVSNTARSSNFIIVSSETFHEGVIGLVAGRLTQVYNKPAIAISIDNKTQIAKGSARSIKGLSIIEELRKYEHLFLGLGGHHMAAGFSIKIEKISELTEAIISTETGVDLHETKDLDIECELNSKLFNIETYNEIKKLKPFGVGNAEPIFKISKLEIYNFNLFGKENQHLKAFFIDDKGYKIRAIGFSMDDKANELGLKSGALLLDIAFSLSVNEYNGARYIEAKLKDIKVSSS